MYFGRRRSHQNKHVLILHLNGVIASVNLLHNQQKRHHGYYTDKEEHFSALSQQLSIRHECVEALSELHTNFQLILFSFYSEQLTSNIVQHLRESNRKIEFDGIYCAQQFFDKQDSFISYNQIYIDFGVIEFERHAHLQ